VRRTGTAAAWTENPSAMILQAYIALNTYLERGVRTELLK
jgi:hypothetical protein